jgi:hypothetical protein
MNDVFGVNGFDGGNDLSDYIGCFNFTKRYFVIYPGYDFFKQFASLQQFCDNVESVFIFEYLVYFHYVRVVKFFEQHYFSYHLLELNFVLPAFPDYSHSPKIDLLFALAYSHLAQLTLS